MQIKNRNRKRSRKLDGIGVRRIRRVSFSSDSVSAFVASDPVRTGSTESEAEAELSANQKTLYKSLSILEQEKNDGSRGKLAEAVRHFPVFYEKSCRDFQDMEQEKKKPSMGGCR